MASRVRPIRILHVLGGMRRGGAETWLMHVLRHIDRSQFRMDFLVHTEEPCAYDDEVRELGSAVIPCLRPSQPREYARSFSRVLRAHGPYDVVHSHVHHFSGYVLRLARHAGVPVRIAHSHNDTSAIESKAGLARRAYLALMERLISAHATAGLACSGVAAGDLFGSGWEGDPRWRMLYCGIDLSPYKDPVARDTALRGELGLPADALVLGHVGRFVEQKNHEFAIRIAAEIIKRRPRTCLLLVGEGPLRQAVEHQAAAAGIGDHVVFAGVRSDVCRLMREVMDVFILPSLHEGLPVVLLEAQAAGLPCVIADTVTKEADAVKPLVRRESLSRLPAIWAETVLAHRERARTVPQSDALALLEASSFNIQRGVKELERVYAS